jgi:pimeloyl-ACP methyl ester carboxylesterase
MKDKLIKLTGKLLNFGSWLFPKYTREVAAGLLSRVPPVRITDSARRFLETAQVHYLDTEGIRTVLYQWGRGPTTVFFLHGWMSYSARWRPIIENLDPEQYSLYALDAPGHGLSQGQRLTLELYRRAYVRALDVSGPVDVQIAHSFGNLISAYQFLYLPETGAKSYIVMGSPSGMDAIFGYFVDILGLSPRMLRNVAKKVDELLKIPHQELTLKAFFEKNERPKLVIHDESDAITPIGPIQDAVKGQRHIETFFTRGLDHTLGDESVNNRILNFIASQTTKEKSYVPKEI